MFDQLRALDGSSKYLEVALQAAIDATADIFVREGKFPLEACTLRIPPPQHPQHHMWFEGWDNLLDQLQDVYLDTTHVLDVRQSYIIV